eukprot:NODE_136_length_18060_cov_0.656645.p6 type:complete len:327 gc:universal NODE_136_length_18060_cov_0.656645:15148-14168(-)
MEFMNSSLSGTCIFDFSKEKEQEVDCKEGDTLMLLCKVDSDSEWILVKNKRTGRTGIVPLTYITINSQDSEAKSKQLSTLREWKYRNSNQIQELLTRNAVSNPSNSFPSKGDRGIKSLNDLNKREQAMKKQQDVTISSAKVTSYERLKDNQIEYIIEAVVNGVPLTLYRPYDEFFYLHLALKSAFPQEREETRRLPLLPVPTQSFTAFMLDKRLEDIDRYVKKLIELDHLKCSKYVIDFFKKQPGDEEVEKSVKIQILSKVDSLAFRTTLSAISYSSLRKRISNKLKIEDFELRDRFSKAKINSTEKLIDLINKNPEKIVIYIPSK